MYSSLFSIRLRVRPNFRKCKFVVLGTVVLFLFSGTPAISASTAKQLIVTVSNPQTNQPVPNVLLRISIGDGVSQSGSNGWGQTNAAGMFSTTGSFECNNSNNIQYSFTVRQLLPNGNMGGGGNASGTTDCADASPINMGLAQLGPSYNLADAGNPGCLRVGEPVNVSNGNMYIRHSDYRLGPEVSSLLGITRSYNSMIGDTGRFGTGWKTELDERVMPMGSSTTSWNYDYLKLFLPDGTVSYAAKTGDREWSPMATEIYSKIAQENVPADYNFTVYFNDGSVGRYTGSPFRIMWKRDRNGNQTDYTYNGSGNLTTVSDSFGRTLTFVSNVNGLITKVSDSHGVVANYEYFPSSRRLKTVTFPDGSKYKFEYTVVNTYYYLSTVKDALDNVLETHAYDGQARAVTSELHGGVEKYTFDYSSADLPTGAFTTVTDAIGRVTKYYFRRDLGKNLLTKREGACSCGGGGSEETSFYYDSMRNLVKITDSLSNDTTLSYDSRGNPLTINDRFGTQKLTYNSFGQVLSYQDRIDSAGLNNTIANVYDSNGNLLASTDALGKTTTITYTPEGLPATVTNARSNATTLAYDTQGRLTQISDAYNKSSTISYDQRARVTSVTNPYSHVTSFEYDLNNRLKKVIYPDTAFVEYAYDLAGRATTSKDERGKITTYEFDPQSRLKKTTDPLGHVKEFGYDLMSNMTSYKDPLGNITDYKYDDFDRLKEIEHPAATLGATRLKERFEYDKLARITKYFDTADRLTQYTYNDATRTNTVTNAELETTQIKYNQRFQTFEVKDALNQTYTFSYDPLGRMLSQTRAGGTMSFEYNEVGSLKKRTDYIGRVTNYSYDNLNRLTQIEYVPNGLGTSTFSNYGYDDVSRLTSATNTVGTVTFAYDNRNRTTSTTDVFNHTIAYEYERTSAINQQRLKFDGTTYAVYNFDNADRLSNIVNSADSSTISFGYDNENKLTSRAYPNGITTTYEYYDNDLLKRILDSSSSSDFYNRQYTYNSARQISQIVEPSRTRNFGYDNVDRLTSVADATYGNESYTFDDVGNRASSHLSTTYGYQSGQFNRLTSTDAATYQFDANGNTTQKDDGVNIWGFDWDHENRMTAATRSSDAAVYSYDALGRRVRRTVAGAAQDTKFIHDGDDVLVDDEGGTLTKYLNGAGIDNKLRVQQGSTVNYFLADHLGSTNGLADTSGTITSQTAYDSFGNQTGSIATRYGFTGRERDDLTGLMYYRARFYDPNLGRFMSEDPIGFGGGDVNLYGYVWNNPLRFVDPTGHDGFGNDFADWADARTEFARRSWQRDPQHWVWNGSANTVADLAFGFNDMFRVGTGLGQAIYCEKLSSTDRMDLVAGDVVRAGSLFLMMAGGVGGNSGATAGTEVAVPTRGFNPFQGRTPAEIDGMFKAKGYTPKGPDPMNGRGTYVSPRGRGYHLDANHPPGKPPHVGAHRPRGYKGRLATRDFPL